MIEVNEQDLASRVITRQAIGRHGSIGNLYDIRDEKLLDENVLDGKHFFTEDCSSKNSFIDRHRSEKETWNKLDIEPSMQLSLRVGLLQEIPEYLQKTIFNSRTVRVTFVFLITTKRQYIQDNLPEQTFDNSNATHYISGITWGKRIFLTFEATSMNSKTAKELENELIAVLEKTTIQDDQIHFENLSNFKIFKILLTDSISIENFPEFDQNLIQSTFNQFIHKYDQQFQFELRPLKNLSNIDSSVYKTIANKIEVCFEEINKEKILINDYLDKVGLWKDWIPFEWRKMPIEINDKESQMKNQMRVLLKKVRSGEMIEDFNVSSSTIKFQTEEIDFKIEILSEFDTSNVEIKQPNATILLKTVSSIENFISNYYDHQIYLLHISNQWIKQDPINWSKQLRCFMKLQETDEKLAVNKPIFRVIDHDLHTHLTDQLNSCTIYHAYRGEILSRDFFRTTSSKTLSLQQIRAIRIENKFTNLTDEDIEIRHKQFIENHPIGEMNKEEFIQEFQQLYPKGNPRSYCNYAFDSIDTDHSETIGFEEFMSAVALTVSGDIDKQLSLIFAVCDHDNSGKVSGAEIIQFLEVIAELENGKESIDYENIQTIAKKMMKSCGKRNDQEEISKDEFIACLKNKYELCMAFLPVVTKKLSEDEINSIHSQHPTLTRDQILEWHKQFLNEHFEGELTRAGFIDEFKKLYPNGHPKPYCDYIFKAIDKNRSGTINFVEFTEAVALTQSNNADIRLKLIFTICDKDNSGTISRNEMAKTIEVIAALNHDLTLPWKDIQSIIDQMITYCGKDANDDLTEIEFIHCCKNNEELGARFLPAKTNQRAESKSDEQSSKFWFEISKEKIKAQTSAENALSNGTFIEPMDFKNLSQLFMTGDDTTLQSILWAFASTLPCSTIVNKEKIDFLYQGFEHETLGWNIAFVFRKFSEEREYLEMISNTMWSSIFQLLDKKNLKEQVQTTIVQIMINIFKNKKRLADEIKRKLQILVIDNDTPKILLLAVLNGLFTIVTSESSTLEEKTLKKLQELLTNENSLIVERTHAILDYLDNKRTLSNSIRYSFNAQVKSELTATQNTSVSQSEEDCIEPTAKFLGLDNLLGKVGHLDRSFTSNVQPTDVYSGDHLGWFSSTYTLVQNLGPIAKAGNLRDGDFEYLLTKFKDDGWHFTSASRDTLCQMIAETFRDSAKAQQRIPSSVTDYLTYLLYNIAKKLNANYDYAQTKLAQTCSECLLTITRNQQTLKSEQIVTVENTLRIIKDTQAKKDLIEIYKLCVTKGHRPNIDLDSMESELLNPSTSTAVSYFFFQSAAVQNQVFSDHQMSLLCSVAKSMNHESGARENCLWAMAYSIKMMSNERSIQATIIDDLGEIVQCGLDTIQNAAVVILCYYVNESNRSLSLSVLERLAVVLIKQDYGLINNVLSIYLKLAKQKHQVPLIALKNMSHFFQDDKQFDLCEKSIWILKYAVDNGQNFEPLVLDTIDRCLNNKEYSIRNTAANVFIQYWNRQILENELDSIDSELAKRIQNLLLFFQNNFDRKVQKSALELIKNLVENNYKLSEQLWDLIEFCLYDHDTSNATTAIMIIASYSKRNLLRKKTMACLEYLLTIDTVIQTNVVDILKTIVCQQEHVLSEKSINCLGQLLLKSIDPNNILILLKHADRYQPLPKAINNLVEQNYLIQVLRHSNCSASLDKAYRRLLSFTDDGIQLANNVLNSIFSLLKSQMRLLNIILNITSNGQHLNNEQITILSEIDLKSNELSLIRIFTNLTRQNHELPKNVMDSFEQFIDNSSVQIYIIEIYQLLIERHEIVDRSIITKIINLLNSSDLTKISNKLNCRIASFFKAVAENQPDEVDQTYFPSLLQLQQSLSVRKDACLAARSLAEHRIILNSQTLLSIIYLLNNDENIDIQNLLLQTLDLAHSNHQITDKSVLQLLNLIHDQDTNESDELLKKLKDATQSGLKLYDRHLTKLSHMLFSCDLNLKRDAATILALMAANGQIPSKAILQSVYATLLDETINQDTIQLLRKSPLNIPSSVIDDLLYLVLFSSQTSVKEIAQEILDHHETDSRVMKFRLMLTMNKLTMILDGNDSLLQMINSECNHKVDTALQIVQNMVITQKRLPIDILLSVTSRITSHADMVLDILRVAFEKDVHFDQSVCKAIENAISDCPTSKTMKLLRLLAEKGFVFQTETLSILFDNLYADDDAFIALEYAAQNQALSHDILMYFIFKLSDELSDIEVVRRSFNIIRQQILKLYVQDPTELLENLRLPNGIDYERLSEIKSLEQRLGTVLTLLSVDCIDLKVFDLPSEQWSREFLCTDLLAQCLDRTPMSIVSFYHQLTQLEQYKKYDLYNDNRDTILQELIRKKQTCGMTLSTINQILIYLQTTSDKSIDILRSNDSNWLLNMRRFFLRDKLEKYVSNQQYSQLEIDHLINQLTQSDNLSVELIEPFLRIINEPTQILTIIDMIQVHQISTNELIQLFANDKHIIEKKSFFQQIEMIILNKTLLTKWSSPREKLLRISNHLKNMLNNGWTFTKLHHMLIEIKIDEEETFESLNQFLESLNLLIDYQIDGSIEEKLSEIFSTVERKFWLEQVLSLVMDRRFDSISSEKNLEMLLNEIKSVNTHDFSQQITYLFKQIDQAFNLDSSISSQGQPIKNWTKSNIKYWAQNFLWTQAKDDFVRILPEMIAVLKRAIYLDSTYHPRLIQIVSILIILDPQHVNGRLLQILTGEGKSSIVSMLAVIKALQGKQVDIVTSSITLAKRDAHERKNFYSMFDLTVAHNNDETIYLQGVKVCYNAHVVYGTSSQFQFDILRHDFSLLNTRGNRGYDAVIIDEADSMLIDENNTIARLADHLPGMEWLNSFLCGIWQCINNAGDNLYKNKYTIIRQFITHLNDPHFEIQVPKHLHRFVQESIPLWIEHAIRAKIEYKLDHHYMIKADETSTKRIVPVDFSNTGVVQCSTTWSDGLHQFLQMKHGLKMTPLTVTTNFLSNTGYFTRYGNEIYGLTGTIGSNDAKELLNKIYQVDTIIIPPFKQKRHFQLETILTLDDDEWLKSIVSTTVSHATNKQAVLIICETRLDAKAVTKELQRVYRTGTVRLYADNTDAIEANVVSSQIQHGEIIVATNLAGRGTDLKTSQEVEKNGGLHVCLTFLPNNLRVEEQAIGRTSRQGQRGTSQMIISRNRTLLQLMSCYPDYLATCNEETNYSIELIRDWRGKAERANIKRIWDNEIPEIRKKDDLFSNFCKLLNQLRQQKDDAYRLISVKERWGLWLKSMDQMNQNRETLERMIEEPGFRCVDVPRDGNSFLNCIARHFSGQLTIENIKKTIIKHIHKNKNLYEKSNENDRYWATCRALNINLVILRSDYGPEIYKRKDAKSTCFLGYEVNLQYVALDTSRIDPQLEGSLLENIEPDAAEIQPVKLNMTDMFLQDKEIESLFLTKASSLDLKDNFKIFANEMKMQYETDDIFQNPCYLLLEADDIIETLSTWSNSVQSYAQSVLPIDEAKTADDVIKRLEQAIKLDSIFAFSALANQAHFIVDKGKSDANYKITAKFYLTQAKKEIEQFIMPQLYLMLIKPNTEKKEIQSKELFFDDLNKQIESKIDILQHYHNYINQAIQVIECSQKLISVQSKHGQIVNIGGKLYRQEVNDFIERYPNTIGLTFHNLTVREDMCFRTDQALQLLGTLTQKYKHISINYFDTKLETIEEIMSKANLSTVCLIVEYLDKDQVTKIIGENRVTLTLIASTEQYKQAIENFKGTVILDMESQRLYLSSDKALEHLNESNKIQSISFESLNQTTVNQIISKLEQVAITLAFPELSNTRMNEICKAVKKPFKIHLQNLSRSTAKNCINATSERNFTMSLCELTVTDTSRILNSFDRNEQDVNSSLKSIANEYAKKDQANEELSAYRNMGIRQFISIQELNPRPWISICVTAGLGAAQIAAGVCLAAATCGLGVQLGIGLITEGISDIYYAVKGAISRNFSWKDYAIQKAISLTLCFVTLGCSAISQGAKAAQATSKSGMEFLKQTFKEAGALIKNSARMYATGAITGTAAKTSFKLALKQVGVVCLETGARELANYAMDSVFPDLLSPLKSSIYDEIQNKTSVQREKEYYDRVLCRALIADVYADNDKWMQKLEETAVKILTKENSAFISIATSLASGITNAAVRHAKSFTGGGNSYVNWASRLLTVLPAINGNYEILMITDNFFAIFEQELTQLEPQIPTFEYFIQQLDSSISQQTATEIRQLLEKNTVINKNGTVNIQLTLREDTLVQNSYQKLVESLKNLNFPDEKHRDLTIKVLSKYQTMDPRSLKANKVQKRIVDMLTDQIIAIIHGTMVAPLANYVVGSAINALSEKIQLKLDSNGTVQDQLMQEGAQRYISNLSNDFVEDIKSGKIKIPSDMEEKLNAFLEKSKDPNFQPENPTEELANAIANGKQGGVIEIAIIAAMTGKSINIVQSEQADESNSKDADMTVKHTAPQVDKEGNIQDGHYESTDGNAESKGVNDCLYASTIGKTSNTFKDTQDMRMKCAAFVLANPGYIMSIQPAINILSGCSNPIRRKQLMMEGGRAKPEQLTLKQKEILERIKKHADNVKLAQDNNLDEQSAYTMQRLEQVIKNLNEAANDSNYGLLDTLIGTAEKSAKRDESTRKLPGLHGLRKELAGNFAVDAVLAPNEDPGLVRFLFNYKADNGGRIKKITFLGVIDYHGKENVKLWSTIPSSNQGAYILTQNTKGESYGVLKVTTGGQQNNNLAEHLTKKR